MADGALPLVSVASEEAQATTGGFRRRALAQTTRLPENGVAIDDRHRAPDRRAGPDRRQGAGRREDDRRRARLATLRAAFWALVGSVVVLYLFFVALDALDPADAPLVAYVVLGLAVLWLAHAWRRLLTGGAASHADRERRGF